MKNQKCITHAKPKSLLPSLFFQLFFTLFNILFQVLRFSRVDVKYECACVCVCVCGVQKIVERFSNLHLFHCIVGTCVIVFRECACANELY